MPSSARAKTKTFSSATVTAGGLARTFTVAVKNNGVRDADNRVHTETVDGRLIVDSVDVGVYFCPDRHPPGPTLFPYTTLFRSGATKSITVHYHVDTATDSALAVGNTAYAH